MPRYRNPATIDFEPLVEELVHELGAKPLAPPTDPFFAAGTKPVIFETPTGLGERLRVTVVWDKWGGLAIEDRNKIIMEAYRRVFGPESANISLTVGVTRSQFDTMTAGGASAFGL